MIRMTNDQRLLIEKRISEFAGKCHARLNELESAGVLDENTSAGLILAELTMYLADGYSFCWGDPEFKRLHAVPVTVTDTR